MNQNFKVRVEYWRPSGTPTTVYYEIEAKSASKARKEGEARVKADPRRKVSSIYKTYAVPVVPSPFSTTASIGGPERPSLQQVAKAQPLVTDGTLVSIYREPIQGTVRLIPGTAMIDIVKDDGQKIRMARAVFEKKTGNKLAPNPRATIVSYHSIYPNDATYLQDWGPVKTSTYNLGDLVQIKITRDAQTRQLISKEFV